MAGKPPATLGRADLLRALHALAFASSTTGRPHPARLAQALLAHPLGFEPTATHTTAKAKASPRGKARSAGLPALPTGQPSAPLRVPMLGAAWVPAADAAPDATVPKLRRGGAAAPLTAADWQGEPGTTGRPPVPLPMVPASRLVPAAMRALQWSRPAGVDVPRLLALMAQRQLPPHLPLARRVAAAPLRILVLDVSGGLEGYLADMLGLRRAIGRALGGAGWQVRMLVDSRRPLAGWTDHTPQPRKPAAGGSLLPVQAWQPLPPEARVVLVSDLGLAGHADGDGPPLLPAVWHDWLACVQALGAAVQVWSPVPLRAATAAMPLPVLHWSAAGTPRPQPLARGHDHHAPERQALAQVLLAALAFCPWIDPALVRAMRLAMGPGLPPALAQQAHDAGIEQLVWQSPDLTRGLPSRRMRPECLARHCHAFETLFSPAQQQRVLQVAVAHYRQFSQPLVHMLTQGWASRAPQVARQPAWVRQRLQQADDWVARLTHPHGDTGVSSLETRLFLHTWMHHGDARQQQHCGPRSAALLQALARWEQVPPSALALPPGASHADLARQLAPDAPQRTRWLLHDASAGQVLLSEAPAAEGQSALWPQALHLATADVQPGLAAPRGWLNLALPQVPLVQHAAGLPARLRTAQGDLWIGAVRRPTGVLGWQRDAAGLHLATQACGRLQLQVPPQAVELLPPVLTPVLPPALPPALGDAQPCLRVQVPPMPVSHPGAGMGIHPEHGLYLDLDIAGVVQRFIWIEPTGPQGFVMGSPEDEHRRRHVDGPQHRVVLTQGFWLADTPCTQALWMAVMDGANPSGFKAGDDAPQRPVEQVSWDDVQGFLAALGQRLQGLGVEAALPTEAQWEYACRAGTQTAYAWGDGMAPGLANVGSERTSRVKQYAPNGWGLYDMHGNVWEWCADGFRTYNGHPQQDPEGPDGDDWHVVRGGAWYDSAAWARSACRLHWHRDDRIRDLGFRLALRSPGLGGQSAVPGGPVLGRGAPPGVQAHPEGAPRGRRQR